MENFQCVSFSDARLSPNVAVATARAGGIGILDCVFTEDAAQIIQNIESLGDVSGHVGVKVHVQQTGLLEHLLAALTVKNCIIVLSWHGATLEDIQFVLMQITKLKPQSSVWLEVQSAEQLQAISVLDGLAAVVAKGHECGGWVGEDAAFILSQKVVAATDLPVFIQGGVGIHTAAACRAIGAAGVVLEEQLLLMPESGLVHMRPVFEGLNGKESVAIGEHFGAPCRILDLPRLKQAQTFKALRDTIDVECDSLAGAKKKWLSQADQYLNWQGDNVVFPMGQGIGLAAQYADTYKTTGRLVQAILQSSASHVALAKKYAVMGENSSLAEAHSTQFPFVQGPMTRVSDTPEFAKAVADGGGLPLIALAVLKAEQIDTILAASEVLLKGQSWGVGLLGFIEQSLYEAQLQSVLKHKPPFALIAGGRPDQAKRLEDEGISTYIHAPTPELLRMFVAQGARKFVFEGRECGGHIGPLSSFVLWEQMIDILLEDMPKGKEADFQLLFAGGVHDGVSAAMVNVLAAKLIERGAKVGVLMGTVYLFTEEAVSQGAILEEFQNQALACEQTINLVTGPGHASRCVNTAFAEEFYATRRKLLKQGVPASEVSEHLDKLNLGRLRIASKGTKRGKDGDIVQVELKEQLDEGMYMIGQVATLHTEKISIKALHEGIAARSQGILEQLALPTEEKVSNEQPSDIAIIGLSTLLPGAHDAETYWDNILNKVDVISEIPKERWDWRLYFDADRKTDDKIYMKSGGFFGEVPFDPMDFGIPPNSLRTIEPIQLLTLGVVRQALDDAGYAAGDFDRENTSVILGASGGLGDLGVQYAARTELDKIVGKPNQEVVDRLPSWNEESFSGLLLNVTAGRVANRFDLGGTNQTVDAACGSSLAAIKNAVAELEKGVANMAIAGGIDTMMSPFSYMCFAKTQALSPSGTPKPFDKNSDGIVISEGISVVVLKRLADAERDGDRIYGVIKGMGSSSDGRALGMTAPLPKGQMRALDRAYRQAGYTPDTVALFEAHGTGTNAGDKAESETIISTLRKYNTKPKNSVLGSVKSQIGHTKATAGTAALIKTVLALYHKVQPPHMNVSAPLDVIADAESPVFILNQKRPWFAASKHPRRAGVSAFGFGGTNYHAALEEYKDALSAVPAGATQWPCELFVVKVKSRELLVKMLQQLHQSLIQGSQPLLCDLAAAYAHQNDAKANVCLSFVVDNIKHLQTLVEQILQGLKQGDVTHLGEGVFYTETLQDDGGKVAWMYPGQGSQYVNMGIEHALYMGEVRESFEQASDVLYDAFAQPLCDIVFPPSAFSKEEVSKQREILMQTQVAQPALAAYSIGLTKMLRGLNLQPDAICGHSLGEYTALCAAGVFDETSLFQLVEARGRFMRDAAQETVGAMAAVKLERHQVETWLQDEPSVVVANHNAPQQTIISGEKDAVEQLIQRMEHEGVAVRLLPVAGAFHSPLLAEAQPPLAEAIEQVAMQTPVVDVYANQAGKPYVSDIKNIKTQLSEHLLGSVEFVAQIHTMYDTGIRTFVEVGAKNVLSNLVGQILCDKPHTCVAMDQQSGSLKGMLLGVAELAVYQADMQAAALFANRAVVVRSPSAVLSQAKPKPLGQTSYWVSGDKVRHHTEPKGSNGRSPMLTVETQRDIGQAQGESVQTSVQGGDGSPLQNVLLSYQQTMRDFLALQEKVVTDFLQDGTLPEGNVLPSASPEGQAPMMPEVVATTSQEQSMQTEAKPTILVQQDLLSLLVSIVAERTGYPEDMLDPDQDMEAELGIDSIKRVEIMGTLQTRLPADVVEQLQNHMDSISRTKSLREMVSQIEALSPSVGAQEPAQQSVGGTAPQQTMPDLLSLLVSIVAERTGYPEDMLDPDQDMEAELGIDSIKRVEIMGTLQTRLPADVVGQLQNHMDSISRTKSLREMVSQIEALCSEGTGDAVHQSIETISQPLLSQLIQEALPRYTMRKVALDDLETQINLDKGVVLITPDQQGIVHKVVAQLKSKGVECIVIPEEVLRDTAELEGFMTQLLVEQPNITGFIHLAGLIAHAEVSSHTYPAIAQVCHQSMFSVIKLLLKHQAIPKRFLSVSMLQAYDEQTHVLPPAMAGGLIAMMKTVRQEHAHMLARHVDFDANMSPKQMVASVVNEFMDSNTKVVEVLYTEGQRFTLTPQVSTLTESSDPLQPNEWVILATGGAKGITAEVLKDLAPFHPTLVLVGRSQLSFDDPMPKVISESDLREALVQQAKQTGQKLAPIDIQKKVKAILSAREMRTNIEALQQLGATVDYRSCDVADEQAFASLIEDVYQRYERIDGVVHAAGMIDDRLIIDKSMDSFQRVFDTKVRSAYTLMQHLRPESLKLLVFFSSVSGRFGNLGQIDYAAANEVLNQMAIQWKQAWPDTHIKSINWGPWDSGTGMVTEAAVQQMADMGIRMIAPSAGKAFFTQEVLSSSSEDEHVVVVASSLGDTALEQGILGAAGG